MVTLTTAPIFFPLYLWELNLTRHMQTHSWAFYICSSTCFWLLCDLRLLLLLLLQLWSLLSLLLTIYIYIYCYSIVLFTPESVHQSYRAMAVISMTSLPYHVLLPGIRLHISWLLAHYDGHDSIKTFENQIDLFTHLGLEAYCTSIRYFMLS